MKDTKDTAAQAVAGFNPQFVTRRDPKTKQIISHEPYKLIVEKGVSYYEWPVGSGNLWWRDRTPAGRIDDKGVIVKDAAHQDYIAPKPESHKLEVKLAQAEQDKARLIKELEEIKREQQYSDKPKAKMPSQKLSEAMTKTKE